MNKINDSYLHIFSPTGRWGDQILNLFAANYHMLNMNKDGLVIHTSKDLWDAHHKDFKTSEKDILKFWSTFTFIKGIFFDVDQRSLPQDAQKSQYELFPFLDFPYNDDFKNDLSQFIDFSLFPPSSLCIEAGKTAVFQPISLIHKPPHMLDNFICEWSQSVKELIEKNYKIYLIGSLKDLKNCKELYPFLFNNPNIIDLMGKISMFEAIELVMKKAHFVLSCDSWSGWYGIASRVKTAYCAGPLIEEGTDKKYLDLIKNKDVFYMDYSSKKHESDSNIAQWIRNNA